MNYGQLCLTDRISLVEFVFIIHIEFLLKIYLNFYIYICVAISFTFVIYFIMNLYDKLMSDFDTDNEYPSHFFTYIKLVNHLLKYQFVFGSCHTISTIDYFLLL